MFSIISLPHTTIRTLGVRIIMSLFCVKRQLYVNYLSNGECLYLLTNITIALSCHIHFDPMRKYSLLLSFTVVLGSQNKLIQNKVFFLILLFNILNIANIYFCINHIQNMYSSITYFQTTRCLQNLLSGQTEMTQF